MKNQMFQINKMNWFGIFLYSILILNTSCRKEEPLDITAVTENFLKQSTKINKIEYEVNVIDTFPNGVVENKRGFVILEKDPDDEVLGYSFYGKQLDGDFTNEYIYDEGYGFEISRNKNNYKLEKGSLGFLGSPGGQMVHKDLFFLDTVYKSAELVEESDRYIINYFYEDKPQLNVTGITKTIELNKTDFSMMKYIQKLEILGNKSVHQKEFKNVKINLTTTNSIADYKSIIPDLELLPIEVKQQNNLLNTKLSPIKLPKLGNDNQEISLPTQKLTLLDFWEVWCGPCIKSFPEVEHLKEKFSDQLQIVGIVTQDTKNAAKLARQMQLTFPNLIGTKEFLNIMGVNSYPRYFLIDRNGVIKKEYHGFSSQIEEDIQLLISG